MLMHKYADYLYKAPEYQCDPITLQELQEECTSCRCSAPGPDGFEPAEMALLPMNAYKHMAALLNLVKGGTMAGCHDGGKCSIHGEG